MTGELGAVGACPGSPLPQGACFPSKVPSEGPFRVAQQQGLESKDE